MFGFFNSDDDSEMHSDTDYSGGFFDGSRPRDGAERPTIRRDLESGEFQDRGDGAPVPIERDPETGEFGPDPYAIGNFGEFNSPYKTKKKDE